MASRSGRGSGDHPEAATRPHQYADAAAASEITLVVVDARGTAIQPLPAGGTVLVGRSSECTVCLTDPAVSRRHVELVLDPPLRLRDLGSANGVRVRGQRLPPHAEIALAAGDVIELGATTLIVRPGAAGDALPGHLLPDPARATSGPAPPATPARLPAGVIVRDEAMREIYALVARIADTPLSVLLLGETGVGKEVVAEAVHRSSARASRAFLRLNCAALSPQLLESELFGHEKGAFTGATAPKPGLLEAADGGTVFLDEVGELPLELQARVLRALEERSVMRVGALRPRAVDVRFVAATNRDLLADVARGAFRQDLYFRLNGIAIAIPPLRERGSELEALAQGFAAAASARSGRPAPPGFAPEALARMRAHGWPGNVRELRNVVERAVALAGEGPVTVAQLPPDLGVVAAGEPPGASAGASSPGGLRSEIEALERRRILDALERCAGNQTRAAALLGMPRRTFAERLKVYGIPRPRAGA